MTSNGKEVMDLTSTMLHAMANYDPTLGHFAIIRTTILDMTPMPADTLIPTNHACYQYLRETGERILPAEDTQQQTIIDSLPNAEEIGDRLRYLGIPPTENLGHAVVLWAAAMAASRFGLTPWNHLCQVIREESAGMPHEDSDVSN